MLEIISTTLVSDHMYIDLCRVNGELKTYLMHRVSPPNIYGVFKEELGDTVTTIAQNIEIKCETTKET